MARIKLMQPAQEAAGKIKLDSNVSLCTRKRSRVCYSYTWNPATVIQPSSERLRCRRALRLATIAASQILADPALKNMWVERFRAQRQYHNLYQFIIASQMKIIKPNLPIC